MHAAQTAAFYLYAILNQETLRQLDIEYFKNLAKFWLPCLLAHSLTYYLIIVTRLEANLSIVQPQFTLQQQTHEWDMPFGVPTKKCSLCAFLLVHGMDPHCPNKYFP